MITYGTVSVDLASQRAEREGKRLDLTVKEQSLLVYFLRNPGKVLTHRAILTAIWGSNNTEQPEYLRVFIANLRKKFELNPRAPKYIKTEPWIGYRFDPE